MTSGGLAGGTLRRITASTADDDVDPAYLPAGRGFVQSTSGTRASIRSADLRGLATPGEPLTMTSPRKESTLLARSFFSRKWSSSGAVLPQRECLDEYYREVSLVEAGKIAAVLVC